MGALFRTPDDFSAIGKHASGLLPYVKTQWPSIEAQQRTFPPEFPLFPLLFLISLFFLIFPNPGVLYAALFFYVALSPLIFLTDCVF